MWSSDFKETYQSANGQTNEQSESTSPDLDSLRSIQPEESQLESTATDRPELSDAGAILLSILLLGSVWMLFRRYFRLAKEYQNDDSISVLRYEAGKVKRELSSAKISCYKCQYFERNMYLPCAVNPTIALKPEAKDCKDFCPKAKS